MSGRLRKRAEVAVAVAVEVAGSLVKTLGQDASNRAAVVAFAGRGVVRCPLTENLGAVLDALNRHRGKGAQKVTVEHVHVHEGDQAIVGNVENPGGGFAPKSKDQPHAQLAYAPGSAVPSADAPREPVSVAGYAERAARRNVTRRSEG